MVSYVQCISMGPFQTIWINFVKEHYAMLRTKFRAYEPSGSEEVKFLNIFLLIFSCLNPGPHGMGEF